MNKCIKRKQKLIFEKKGSRLKKARKKTWKENILQLEIYDIMKLTIDLFDRIEGHLNNAVRIEERQVFELEKDSWLNRKNLLTKSNYSNISLFKDK